MQSVSFQQLLVQRLQLFTDEFCIASHKTRTFINTSEKLDTRTVFNKLQNVLTCLLTPWSRVLLEKLTGSAASQEIPRVL